MSSLMFNISASLLILLGITACTEDPKIRTYEIAGNGAIQLAVPQSWEDNELQAANQPPRSIVLSTKEGNSAQIILAPAGPHRSGTATPTDEELRAGAENASAAIAGQSVETSFPVRDFKGASAAGYYFVATDKAPKAGEFKYLAQGMLRSGELTAAFTVLSNDPAGKTLSQALAMLKTAIHVPAGTAKAGLPDAPAVPPAPFVARFQPPASAPDAVTTDGGKYYGPLVDGRLHGKGLIIWPNGAGYEGSFEMGLMSGKGKYQSVSFDYEGDFKNGMKNGRGRYSEPGGVVYLGEFANDLFNGQGRFESDGTVYEGQFADGDFEGAGKWTGDGEEYRGEFRKGKYSGQGEVAYADGRKYKGAFENGMYQGKGRYEAEDGQIYEGDFSRGDFEGQGSYRASDGSVHSGTFRRWEPHGPGTYTDARGSVYAGTFADGELAGQGVLTGKDGRRYEGEFKSWKYHGQGIFRYPNGDEYKGGFAYGLFEGEGVYRYAKPKADGRTEDAGTWRYGALENKEAEQQSRANVEAALYNQRTLLDKALAALTPREPGRINMYLLAVGGDGSQEVFRREVEFVSRQFDREFGTKGHSVALINSRNTVADVPMATLTSIRESVSAIAAKMDRENDILFLFLTSHGSKDHKLTLDQNGMSLRNLDAKELGKILRDAGIRWKVVTISACYAGGFIDPIKDDRTMVITAARHDRTSFGCADENDFTYFGRAFFQESLQSTKSFSEAFQKARTLVAKKETEDFIQSGGRKAKIDHYSEPQIHSAAPIEQHLGKWRAQLAAPQQPVSKQGLHATLSGK